MCATIAKSNRMHINDLTLKNFRNYDKKAFTFDKTVNLITGNNGTGKTNILEAIFILATGKSPRARYDKDYIRYEQTACSISGSISTEGEDYALQMAVVARDDYSNLTNKKVTVNKVAKSVNGFSQILNAVLFSPEDINLITGSPTNRRKYLDFVLIQAINTYKKDLSKYTHVVKQRNKILELLNLENRGKDQLDLWNEQFIVLAEKLHQSREIFVDFTKEHLHKIAVTLELGSSPSHIEFEYQKSSVTQARLQSYYEKEVRAMNSLIGPHRDDFSIKADGKDIGEFGSRGQQRTTVLALKMLEIGFIEKFTDERPILLLDDIFSELDDIHRTAIRDIINKQQTIATSAEPVAVLHIKPNKIIPL